MRCSACFAECCPTDSIPCVVCSLVFHVRCTSWKNLEPSVVHHLKNSWHCIFCRKNLTKSALFTVDDPDFGVRQINTTKRNANLSTKNFERKVSDFKKTNYYSSRILDDMKRSLTEVRESVGSLSARNEQTASAHFKLQRIVGDIDYKLQNLCLI